MTWPKWTVVYNIVRPGNFFIGKGWEFFFEEEQAQHCYDELVGLGHVPTKRPFHPNDRQHMNPVDLRTCEETEEGGGYREFWFLLMVVGFVTMLAVTILKCGRVI